MKLPLRNKTYTSNIYGRWTNVFIEILILNSALRKKLKLYILIKSYRTFNFEFTPKISTIKMAQNFRYLFYIYFLF